MLFNILVNVPSSEWSVVQSIFSYSFLVYIKGEVDATEYRMILSNPNIKQWRQFIKSSNNKLNFIRFLCNEWKKIHFRSKLEGTEMYLAYDEECFRVTTENVEEVSYLGCNHNEAET